MAKSKTSKNFVTWLTEELSSEDGPFVWTKEETISWLKDIQDNLILDSDKKDEGRHYGDCVKQNISCRLCMYMDWLEKYYHYIKEEQ